ncbi:hypothetical protein AWRI3579_g816 [Hanseniaspora osmophila]|uniref:Vacuolar membrane protein n=1 Tax=Hanseniaspora osmophila TaxID=56408 RepID=A0A1E5RNM8_9ASCO|nr:hypothetical protein AWRI3579_g816 [Hanseniaspora osmophila]
MNTITLPEEQNIAINISGLFRLFKAKKMDSSNTKTRDFMYPLITPPLPDGNPYIWKSKKPEGFVFIIVGLFAVLVFSLLFIWYAIQGFLSIKAAKSTVHHYENEIFEEIDSFASTSSSSKIHTNSTTDAILPVLSAKDGNPGNEKTNGSYNEPFFIQEQPIRNAFLPDSSVEEKNTIEKLDPVYITSLRSAGKTKRKPTPSMHLDALLYGSPKQIFDFKNED